MGVVAAGDPKASGNLLLLHHRGSGLQHSQLLPAGATLTPPPLWNAQKLLVPDDIIRISGL